MDGLTASISGSDSALAFPTLAADLHDQGALALSALCSSLPECVVHLEQAFCRGLGNYPFRKDVRCAHMTPSL